MQTYMVVNRSNLKPLISKSWSDQAYTLKYRRLDRCAVTPP